MNRTSIPWCDYTVNPVSGCQKVGPDCTNCYAETLSQRNLGTPGRGVTIGKWGPNAPRKRHEAAFAKAHAINRRWMVCDACGYSDSPERWHTPHENAQPSERGHFCQCGSYHRARVFLESLGDWLDPRWPIAWFAETMEMVRSCANVRWITVTKRASEFPKRCTALRHWYASGRATTPIGTVQMIERWQSDQPPEHVVVMGSAGSQEILEARAPDVLKIPAVCHGLSLEPLLGPVDLTRVVWRESGPGRHYENVLTDNISDWARERFPEMKWPPFFKWVVVGGESGHHARPCNADWIYGLTEQCRAWQCPVFVKQLGAVSVFAMRERPWLEPRNGLVPGTVWQARLRDAKGGDPGEWPADLQGLREFPEVLRG